ncbi:oxygen-evolving enhancer protein 3, chloroplastic [Oryza brachyantha]|uniref:oxygen-evolving enhancer protein 3, chloroplastic n=1 Tax=Oryza brachyantha TaxID=4533 RepID=UPI001ADA44AF|nr:oxygen-evolving enhancer protein 3, chloroplastic [Oryza brachyantha]
MAQAMASMTGLSQGVLPAGAASRGRAGRSSGRIAAGAVVVRASAAEGGDVIQTGRRAVLGLVATGVAVGGAALAQAALAEPAKSIKVGPPPPPSGGLPGTLNSDQARDVELPLKERFYLQPLPPAEAAARAKESAKDIINLKPLIDKKQWPYVRDDLRLKASYLRYDLKTIISSKPKDEKKDLKDLTGKLFATIDGLDHAAKIKSPAEAEKYYTETKSVLGDVLAKLG